MLSLEKTITSLEVSEMVGREHKEVLRDIRNILDHLGESKIARSYFIKSSYKTSQNKELPCYLLSKKGCELYGTRITGEKGTLFALKYVELFNEMEEQIKPKSQLELMQMQIQQMIEQEKKINEMEVKQFQLENKIDSFSELVATNSDDWRRKTDSIIKGIAFVNKDNELIRKIRNEIYEAIDKRAKTNLEIRLSNFKKRCLELGVPASKVDKKNKLDIIEQDAKLIEIYVALVKEYAIKYKGVK